MSLPLYQANDAISVAIQSDHFKSSFRDISAKLRESPNQLGSFDSMESIVEAFVADYESSDDFTFVANANTGEEEVFQLHGVLSETRLPPVLKGNRVSMTSLVQTVKLISIDDDEDFRIAGHAASRMLEFLQQSTGASVQAPYAVQHGIAREFTAVNWLLTPSHSAFPEDVIDLPSTYDPGQTLKSSIDEGKFAFTKDNQVAFNKLTLDEGNHLQRIMHIKPGTFRPGQIVNIGVSFRLIKSQNSSPMRFIAHLDSILDDRRFQKSAPTRGLPAKRRPFNEKPKVKGNLCGPVPSQASFPPMLTD
ncbi:hypothetical protein ARMSODRAFT_975057 [Armillaria solidipes]|uniref:Uncharacterized protein n=1 Tax=Armillaria solidipes TaxID=1076256 RepID=A0A2H3BTE7_9AGAR|nr:hypothetical protein ARMSODRAFT_975057 [Armillaria solidipes]